MKQLFAAIQVDWARSHHRRVDNRDGRVLPFACAAGSRSNAKHKRQMPGDQEWEFPSSFDERTGKERLD